MSATGQASTTTSASARPGGVPGRGHELDQLRRSGAAGLHVKYRKDRLNTRRLAIAADRRAG
jgi:hypothetical protein